MDETDEDAREMEAGRVTETGCLECPYCKTKYITPDGRNPNTGVLETRTLDPKGGTYSCKMCRCDFIVTPMMAWQHNHYHFPGDPVFFDPPDKSSKGGPK